MIGHQKAKLSLGQSQKKQKLSGQQDICRLNFPDEARKSRQFLNSQQMSVKGVHARSFKHKNGPNMLHGVYL